MNEEKIPPVFISLLDHVFIEYFPHQNHNLSVLCAMTKGEVCMKLLVNLFSKQCLSMLSWQPKIPKEQ